MCFGAINLNFRKNWESYRVVKITEFTNFLISSWLLSTKLIAWETKDNKISIFIGII